MKKKIPYIFWTITVVYIFSNFKRIKGAFQSDIWSKEIDLVNHVASFTVQLQVIAILLVIGSLMLAWTYWKNIRISNYILWTLSIISIVLWVNTQVDFIRWIEINVIGAGGLLFFLILLLINTIWRLYKPYTTQG